MDATTAQMTAEVWMQEADALRALARALLRDEHAAEDLVQEVFLRVHDSIAELRDAERLGPWVYRIARNVLADRRRALSPEQLPHGEEPAFVEDEAENLNAEVERWLRAMLCDLPAASREAVQLADLERLSQRAIAERLGLSLSGAKSRVQRGRRQLWSLLRSCCHLELDRRGNVLGYERRGTCASCECE
jgi:RNA polymerase sigma-70 factor (ECF subfamily)